MSTHSDPKTPEAPSRRALGAELIDSEVEGVGAEEVGCGAADGGWAAIVNATARTLGDGTPHATT